MTLFSQHSGDRVINVKPALCDW